MSNEENANKRDKQKSAGKVKLLLILAICLVVFLLICSAVQIFSLNNKRNIINQQREEIARLEDEIKYWENVNEGNNDTSLDNKVEIDEGASE